MSWVTSAGVRYARVRRSMFLGLGGGNFAEKDAWVMVRPHVEAPAIRGRCKVVRQALLRRKDLFSVKYDHAQARRRVNGHGAEGVLSDTCRRGKACQLRLPTRRPNV